MGYIVMDYSLIFPGNTQKSLPALLYVVLKETCTVFFQVYRKGPESKDNNLRLREQKEKLKKAGIPPRKVWVIKSKS